ncbi:MAG TPA: mechanosensitive ion channel domain-containing protein [Candidatus Limnocylindrales bacterium]
MPDLTAQTSALIDWLTANGLPLAVSLFVLLLAYRWARPALHRILVELAHRQSSTMGDEYRRIEVEKRVETLEDLLAKVLRGAVGLALGIVVLGLFDLWPVITGLGVVAAAITLAGQSIVLDYLMGILILVEGQYFKGDIVRVGGLEGTVEEVGLRRTVIRDPRGTLHSISNGEIRMSSNRTRSYAMLSIQIDGIADGDVERAIAVLDAVGAAVAADPDLADALIDTPGYTSTTSLSAYGATLLMSGRVQPEQRIRVEAELRRRVAAEMAAVGITPIRPTARPTAAPGAGLTPGPG